MPLIRQLSAIMFTDIEGYTAIMVSYMGTEQQAIIWMLPIHISLPILVLVKQ